MSQHRTRKLGLAALALAGQIVGTGSIRGVARAATLPEARHMTRQLAGLILAPIVLLTVAATPAAAATDGYGGTGMTPYTITGHTINTMPSITMDNWRSTQQLAVDVYIHRSGELWTLYGSGRASADSSYSWGANFNFYVTPNKSGWYEFGTYYWWQNPNGTWRNVWESDGWHYFV
jgi:hypothetical protein